MVPTLTTPPVNDESPRISTKRLGNVLLFDHQRAMSQRMLDFEQEEVQITDRRVGKSTVGILCDPVGAGKSNTVLCMIATRPTIESKNVRPVKSGLVGSNAHLCVWEHRHVKSTGRSNLIIVPHGGVFKQWKQYIQNSHVDFQAYDTRKSLEDDDNKPTATCILVSSTVLKDFLIKLCEAVVFNRVIIDEADSIAVPNMREIKGCMYWLVTSSWRNLAFWSGNIPVPNSRFIRCEGVRHNGFIKDMCKGLFSDLSVSSFVFLACDLSFIERSFNLPPVVWNEHVCKTPTNAIGGMIRSVVSQEVASMINAGDVAGAIGRLGCTTASDVTSLTQALTRSVELKLQERRARLTYITNVYGASDPRCSEIRLTIDRLENQINSVVQRCCNVDEDVCPVCFDTPGSDGPVCAIKCCCKVFCLNCLQKAFAANPKCVMCRTPVNMSTDVVVISSSGEKYDQFLSKEERLLQIIEQNPDGKFLVFSMHDRTFSNIREWFESKQITNDRLCGNTNQIVAKLKRFETGALRVLMLNANHFGQGYNLQSATHVVLYHRMSDELTKQMVGRAQRYGRTTSLVVEQLVHVGESTLNSVC